VRVKICGVRSESDVDIAVGAGAHAVGFLVGLTHASEDELDAVDARRLVRRVPPFVEAVLVTHLVDPLEIAALTTSLGVSTVQLHGDMDAAAVRGTRDALPLTKLVYAVHVTAGTSTAALQDEIASVSGLVDAVVLDSRTEDRVGGTGRTHDWSISRRLVESSPVPVILAGGLTPTNVASAIREVRPYAVDVNSGVETGAGDKSPELCSEFVRNAGAEGCERQP
jgi:phosphoribosylanthranilate isomerase